MNVDDDAREQAEAFARALSSQTDLPFDFSLTSLARLDGVLREWLDLATVYDDERPQLDHLVYPVALYVAETLRRHGGRWIEGSSSPSHGAGDSIVVALAAGRMIDLTVVTRAVLSGAIAPCFQRLAVEAPPDAG